MRGSRYCLRKCIKKDTSGSKREENRALKDGKLALIYKMGFEYVGVAPMTSRRYLHRCEHNSPP